MRAPAATCPGSATDTTTSDRAPASDHVGSPLTMAQNDRLDARDDRGPTPGSPRTNPHLDAARCRPGRSRARRNPHRPNYPILYSTFNKSDFSIGSSRLYWSIFKPGPNSLNLVSISKMGISHLYDSETLFPDLTTNRPISTQVQEIYYPHDTPFESLYKIPTCAIFRS